LRLFSLPIKIVISTEAARVLCEQRSGEIRFSTQSPRHAVAFAFTLLLFDTPGTVNNGRALATANHLLQPVFGNIRDAPENY